MLEAALKFPPIGELVKWPAFGLPGFNKVALICVLATVFTAGLFFWAGMSKTLVPNTVQNIVESVVEFITDGVILQTMGQEGMKYLWYLTSLFFFIFFCNIFEIIPFMQFPASARMAIPLLLAVITWVMYIVVGLKKHGISYVSKSVKPPGVPFALLFLIIPIELLSTFIVRPFSLAVRLFANMLAGHLLLVTFAVLTGALLGSSIVFLKPVAILPLAMDIAITGFEAFVAILQAFIFTILTAVYLGSSIHIEH
ncbi:MAG: F-type H+-transporting ATPase subunit a [Acidimicrobiaceae bacterium]|jgi:F-type H+-transporting ATPase subunit a|nr:F-type H+-transporting ATPase subunit a [Acidimicrobiaceae bacterium]MDQ1369143.1 F-type H+-transporting ATPase subunit a [Acidimicrobiaceae bacterium]MDQ1399421.1 F-type H+-transporting ATPase subunit a [Acidimicrobiaceae bacterium]MDQ1413947.1 F-type H+-transporting ATPase subunit a [Acidimicrobiaceae bacterium]MDQ1417387.1 F-type H+-transporting ATPase subunit a [Acidimicrobiaceae bacterium]